MPTILNFTNLTHDQIDETIAVFAGHKEDILFPVPVLPGEHLVFEDELPKLDSLTGAILNWADPNIAIVLAILALRQRIHGEDFRLYAKNYGHLTSWHLIPRYNKFCRPTANEEEQERGFLIGEWPRPRLSSASWIGSIDLILWERQGLLYDGIMTQRRGRSPLFLELPGDWWGQFECSEFLSDPA